MTPIQHKADREILIEYMKMKTRREDWHGVSDAANDLRELDAEARGGPALVNTPR